MSLTFSSIRHLRDLVVYINNLIACSATLEARVQLPEKTFQALQATELILKPHKKQLRPNQVKYLWHVLSTDGLHTGDGRIKGIADRSLLGMIKFALKIIPDLATVIDPSV